MTDLTNWPAFKGLLLSDLPQKIVYERGIWGKVHTQASDFRWIARSEGFNKEQEQDKLDFGRLLNLGSEDKPVDNAYFWFVRNDLFYAIRCYKSRAEDKSGRLGFLEKQIIEWRPGLEISPVLVAMLILPKLDEFSDKIWWDHHSDTSWDDSDFVLTISDNECQPIEISPERLSEEVDKAVNYLKNEVTQEELVVIYSQILGEQYPVFLPYCPKPLSSHALAAILLPLSLKMITEEKLSLAGWIPSKRADSEVYNKWKIVVLPEHLSRHEMGNKHFDKSISKKAELMAEAIYKKDPSKLCDDELQKPAKSPSHKQQEEKKTPPKRQSHSTRPLKQVFLDLKKLPDNAPQYMKEIYDFARRIDRRWLIPEKLKGKGDFFFKNNHPWKEHLFSWIDEVKSQGPTNNVDERQWQVKIDLLKALTIILVPNKDIEAIQFPENSYIPALFYITLLDKKIIHNFFYVRYGEEISKKLFKHSGECCNRNSNPDLIKYLEKLKPYLKDLMKNYLKT